ncbi:hypothetical protein CAOG_009859 [Capsaspora owczarzaki ATCC 30864]|uniref:Uncharacterized protein n=1 Tax=Capsaspora owczarzaki (strain ATCC 30864) TaxID=595528 RepID=A0A0D2X3U7_CAPO3|nr:hypothetical protein CAOG_009859 [Capsaspora owczarzaki ATCC 30864]
MNGGNVCGQIAALVGHVGARRALEALCNMDGIVVSFKGRRTTENPGAISARVWLAFNAMHGANVAPQPPSTQHDNVTKWALAVVLRNVGGGDSSKIKVDSRTIRSRDLPLGLHWWLGLFRLFCLFRRLDLSRSRNFRCLIRVCPFMLEGSFETLFDWRIEGCL